MVSFIENRGGPSINGAVTAIHTPGGVEVIITRAEADLGTTRQHGFGAAILLVQAIKKGNRGATVTG